MEETKPMTKYVVGQTYDFTVNSVRYNFCELVDGDGFFVYLQHTRKDLTSPKDRPSGAG